MKLSEVRHKPRTASTRIVMDDDLRERIEELRARIAQTKLREARELTGLTTEVPALEAELEEAEAEATENAVLFTFRALPRQTVADLVREFPPSEEQIKEWREERRAAPLVARDAPQFDWDEFAPRLIARSMVEPEGTEEELLRIWGTEDPEDGWSDGIWAQLWRTAWSVNQEASVRPIYGNDTRQT